ncbi:MAG: polysaccharide chain length determinant protein (PEP-CTERM system associated) [Moritella sp.]|jgi:polysaccharide chain length determinant protein (PEP-CTERM system associated)
MELSEIFKYIKVAWRELCQRKFKVALTVTVFSFAIMFLGMVRLSNFYSSVTIFADNQNIIKPLLGSKASVTGVKQNRTEQVRDIINSPRLLTQVITSVYGENAFPTAKSKDIKLSQLRKNITIKGMSGNYIKITYKDDSAERTFEIINKVVSLFIEDSANAKREESRNAYNFIEQQTDSYKALLLAAEGRLKNFQSTNFDGTEAEVNGRIASLRATIEEMKIQVQESKTRVLSLENQLSEESKFASNNFEEAVYYTQLKNLEQKKAELLLKYREDYPDVIKINYQITDLKKTISEVNLKKPTVTDINSEYNPLYKELRSKRSAAEVETGTLLNRLNAFNNLLNESYERRKRIANNKAELSELTRDYSVFQAQYEDMLAKKEKARISMVLDIQGQGVNFKLQEAATYPNTPTGPRFIHFFIAGPIVGLILILILLISKVILDNRIRFAEQLRIIEGVPVLATLGHATCNKERKQRCIQNYILLAYTLIAVTTYMLIALTHKYGIPVTQLLELGAF